MVIIEYIPKYTPRLSDEFSKKPIESKLTLNKVDNNQNSTSL